MNYCEKNVLICDYWLFDKQSNTHIGFPPESFRNVFITNAGKMCRNIFRTL